MIVLNYSATTTSILELLPSTTGATPIYLFEVTKVGDTTAKLFIATDVSQAPCRYQQFDITLSSTENLLNGTINLIPAEYDYTIYEVDTLSLTANRQLKLQTGILIVEGTIDSVYA